MEEKKYKQFYKFCKLYKKQLKIEKKLSKFGIILGGEGSLSLSIDEFISMIPDLIFNEKGSDLFWESLKYSENFTNEYIDELWNKLKEYQL